MPADDDCPNPDCDGGKVLQSPFWSDGPADDCPVCRPQKKEEVQMSDTIGPGPTGRTASQEVTGDWRVYERGTHHPLATDLSEADARLLVFGGPEPAERTELEAFVAMLERANIGHGQRVDFNPAGTAVQVEHEDDNNTITDWWFDAAGNLRTVYVCQE